MTDPFMGRFRYLTNDAYLNLFKLREPGHVLFKVRLEFYFVYFRFKYLTNNVYPKFNFGHLTIVERSVYLTNNVYSKL